MSTATPSTDAPIPGATPLFGATALARADHHVTTRHRLPSIVLMERAGAGAAATIRERFDTGAALVVCGAGNNGGDGYVVARHLADAGWNVEIAVPRGLAPRTPDAMTMAQVARSLGLRPRAFTPTQLDGGRLVVDALLGIGASGPPRDQVAATIAAINRGSGPVVAIDVPSGLDADSGRIQGFVVAADLTITFHGDKPGLHIEPGRGAAGAVVVQDIGIPSAVRSPVSAWLLGIGAGAAPHKTATSDKYASGAVLVIAGSPGLTGAGVLTSRATLRAGAGLTVAAVPAAVQPIYASQMVEVMAAPIPDSAGHFTAESVEHVVAQAERVDAIAIGPGLGRDPRTNPFVRAVLERIDLPAVIDADGLWHLGRRPSWLRGRTAPTVITPHAGEAARLLGRERAQIEAERLASALALAETTGTVAVLKGPGAIVADPDGVVCVDGVGTTALATAGSGDVLTGVLATLLAKGMGALAAAATAVALHSRAGVCAGRGDGTLAGDIIDTLPEVLGR